MLLPENQNPGTVAPITLGTRDNIATDVSEGLGMDWEGIWWMRDNPVPEEILTFAGMTTNSTTFPAQISIPNSLKNRWAWVDSLAGKLVMTFYALTYNPSNIHMKINFHNASYAEIETALTDLPLVKVEKWPFIKLNANEWLRPTIFQEDSIFSDQNYTMTRIVNGDGTPTGFFQTFVDHMKKTNLLAFGSDEACKRKCMLYPVSGSCRFCNMYCRS